MAAAWLVLAAFAARPADAARVQVVDFANGSVIGEYAVPPTNVIVLERRQTVVLTDVKYGDPDNPFVYVEIIDDVHLLLTLDDGTMLLIENFYRLLEDEEDVALVFADSGQYYGAAADGTGGIEVPVFASVDDFLATATGPAMDMPAGSGTGGRTGFAPLLRASRAFEGPDQFPPHDVPAYGIVAFPTKPSDETRRRAMRVCEAYMSVLLYTGVVERDFNVLRRDQMITVWPVQTGELATELNRKISANEACADAVEYYELSTAVRAILEAKKAGAEFGDDIGPFLIAWAPSSAKGKTDTVVLVSNLSCMNRFSQLEGAFKEWVELIQENQELWGRGDGWFAPVVAKVKERARIFLDCNAPVLSFIGGDE